MYTTEGTVGTEKRRKRRFLNAEGAKTAKDAEKIF